MVRITRAGVALTVGIILVIGLIIAGLFWVKEQGETARRDDAILIAEEALREETDNAGVALNDGDTEEEATNDGATQTPADESETANEAPAGGSGATNDQSSVEELPATGSEGLSAVIAVAALTFSAAAYVQSRRQLNG